MAKEFEYNNEVFKHIGIRNYFISEGGNVANVTFDGDSIKRIYILKSFQNPNGYMRIALKYEPNKERKYLIHRLVYTAFIGILLDDLVIDHIDGNRSNNHYTNLRQVTQKENINNSIKSKRFGRNNANKIIVYDKETELTHEFDMIKDFFEYFGIKTWNGALNTLDKYPKFKNRFIITKIKKG